MAGGDDRGGRRVDLDGVAHVLGVAAGQHHADRDVPQPVQHQLVARPQAVLGQRQPAKPVALPRVCARQVEGELGAGLRDGVVERVRERRQVRVVARAALEVDVQVGRDTSSDVRACEDGGRNRFPWVIARAVERQREALRIAAEQVRRAVALVDVAVDHQRSPRPALGAHPVERHGDVVEQAVAARKVAPGVVGAAAEVHAEPVLERVARRRHRPADRPPAALHERLRPRDPEPALLAHAQRAGTDALDQRRLVDRLQPLPRHRLGVPHLDPVRLDPLAQQRVLVDREPVALGEREAPAVMRPNDHAAANSSSATRAEAPAVPPSNRRESCARRK
jgi:hypothetical protein